MKRFQKVLDRETEASEAGTIYSLHLACGHVKRVTPAFEKAEYRQARTQKRAKCPVCTPYVTGDDKECSQCHAVKPLADFFIYASGRVKAECLSCGSKRHAKHIKDTGFRTTKRTRQRHRKKYRAQGLIHKRVFEGKLAKPTHCEECRQPAPHIHAHHDDYDKPLDVRWLCPTCHSAWHKEHGEAANPDDDPHPFRTGDVVTWTSQANGTSLTKRGEVVQIIPAGDVPPGIGCGRPRDHESYLVAVSPSGKLYWPRVSVLIRERAALPATEERA